MNYYQSLNQSLVELSVHLKEALELDKAFFAADKNEVHFERRNRKKEPERMKSASNRRGFADH